MPSLVNRIDELTMSVFRCKARDFILNGLRKGRHYFYLRDVLGLTDRKFTKLLEQLDISKEKVLATQEDYHKLFAEHTSTEDADEFEDQTD